MPFDKEAAFAHAREAVNDAPLSLDPFPHLLISNIFPDEIYQRILAEWPEQNALYTTNSDTRHEVRFGEFLQQLDQEKQEFWKAINRYCDVANRVIQSRLLVHTGPKFEPYLGPDWRDQMGAVECTPGQIHFATYTGKFRLPPHVDHIRLITNAFVYVSENPEPEPDLGTIMYRSRGMMHPTNWELEPKLVMPYLEEVAVSPYVANGCFAYINGPASFHGVNKADIGERRRRLLMFGSKMYVREMKRIFGDKIGDANFG